MDPLAEDLESELELLTIADADGLVQAFQLDSL